MYMASTAMDPCQMIVKTLLRAVKSHESCILFRELRVAAEADENAGCGFKLRAFHDEYLSIVGVDTAIRVDAFDETVRDLYKVRQADTRLGADLQDHLLANRTWWTWWTS